MANSEYNYTPMYIRRTINNRPKDVVTAKYWNELFNLLIAQGDHTAEELGNILNYFSTRLIGVENGIAESAEAIANIREVFRVNVTYSNGVYSADKTFNEIKAAYDAGQLPYVVDDALSGFYDIYTLSHFWYDASSAQGFVDFERYLIQGDTLKTDTLRIHSHAPASGSNIERRIEALNVPRNSYVLLIEGTESTENNIALTSEQVADLQNALQNNSQITLLLMSGNSYAAYYPIEATSSEIVFGKLNNSNALFGDGDVNQSLGCMVVARVTIREGTGSVSFVELDSALTRFLPLSLSITWTEEANSYTLTDKEYAILRQSLLDKRPIIVVRNTADVGGAQSLYILQTGDVPSTYNVDSMTLVLQGLNDSIKVQMADKTIVLNSDVPSVVKSVNGQTGVVVLDASDVGAQRTLIAGSGITIIPSADGDIIQSDVSCGNGVVSFVDEEGGASIAQFTLNQTEDCEINVNTLTARLGTKVNNLETSLSNNYRTAADQDAIDATKQSIITDLATIRSGASLGATAVQPEAGKGLFSGSYNDLTDKPTIPDISSKQDKLIAGEGITIAADGKTISSSGGGKVSSVNGKTGAVTLNAEDIIYAKESQKLDVTIAGLKAADIQTASDISELQTADASLDSRITAIETGDTPVTLYIYWASVTSEGRVSLTQNGAAMSVADFISKMQSGAKITIGENNDTDSESSGFTNYRYKITDSTTASLAFDVANSFNGSNRTIIISGSSSTAGLMHGYQDIGHDDLSDYSPLPEGSTPASKAWVENYVDEKAAALQSKSITDSGGYFHTDTVESALQEIGAELAGLNVLLGSGIQISFTIDIGEPKDTFSAVSGETWKEWIGGYSRVISEISGLTLYCYSDDGIIFADEAGVNALGLNDVWVHGNETIVPGATYAIIPYGG